MKTIGIITEYNPFHLGHEWQIRQARAKLGEDCAVVTVMSGAFTQRGEPGIMSKWDRAKAAMACGVNLVIELPYVFATASAERFASGGIDMLLSTGVIQNIVFGSESGNLASLQELAQLLCDEPDSFKKQLRASLDSGLSFPVARQQAAAVILGSESASLLTQSNNILAIEYLKALHLSEAAKKPEVHTIARSGQSYNDKSLPEHNSACFASASSIRREIAAICEEHAPGRRQSDLGGLLSRLTPYMPSASLAVLLSAAAAGKAPLLYSDLTGMLLAAVRSMPAEELCSIAYMQEGLDNRIAEAARRPAPAVNLQITGETGTLGFEKIDQTGVDTADGRLETLLRQTDTRRFPRTRIQRALLAALTHTKSDDDMAMRSKPQYLRILAFDKKGRHLLKLMRKHAALPVITRASDFLEYGRDSLLYQQASKDLLASDLWSLAAGGSCGTDFDTEVVIG